MLPTCNVMLHRMMKSQQTNKLKSISACNDVRSLMLKTKKRGHAGTNMYPVYSCLHRATNGKYVCVTLIMFQRLDDTTVMLLFIQNTNQLWSRKCVTMLLTITIKYRGLVFRISHFGIKSTTKQRCIHRFYIDRPPHYFSLYSSPISSQ